MAIAVMIALQRTGTHALGSVIGQHPMVRYTAEVFSPRREDTPGGYLHFLSDRLMCDPEIALPKNAFRRFNQYVDYLEKKSDKPISLLDVKYSSLHHFDGIMHPLTRRPAMLDFLEQHKVPVIHLIRRNVVRMTVSNLMAETTQIYTTESAQDIRKVRLQVDPEGFLNRAKFLHSEMRVMCDFLKSYPNIATLEYAELFEGNELSRTAERKIVNLLGIPDFEAHTPTIVKQIPEPLDEVIANFDELAATLRPTIFAPMLFEDEVVC